MEAGMLCGKAGEAWIPPEPEAALELQQVTARKRLFSSTVQDSNCAGASGHPDVPQRAET